MTDATRLRLATYSRSAAASLGLFKTRVAALLALAAIFLASAAAKRSLTDKVRGWGHPSFIIERHATRKSKRSFLESL